MVTKLPPPLYLYILPSPRIGGLDNKRTKPALPTLHCVTHSKHGYILTTPLVSALAATTAMLVPGPKFPMSSSFPLCLMVRCRPHPTHGSPGFFLRTTVG